MKLLASAHRQLRRLGQLGRGAHGGSRAPTPASAASVSGNVAGLVDRSASQAGWARAQRFLGYRLIGLALAFALLFGVLTRRAWVLQVRQYAHLHDLAEEQYLNDVELPARRGRILDRNGAELAASVEVDSVQATPKKIQQMPGGVDRIAPALARALGLDVKEVTRKLHLPRYTTWIKRRISPDEARNLRELALPGVLLTREPRRFYPNRNLAGLVVGWAGVDGKGLEGIELQHDRALRGSSAAVAGLRDALGRELFTEGESASDEPGHDVITTIDKFIQYRLERALEDGLERSHAKAATAVVLDPQNGEVLAMAALPSLNPNDPPSAEHGARNRAVTDPFEPGSTMKTFSITAAIEAGLVHLEDKWFCENGHFQIGKATIHDAEPNGVLSTIEVLAKSSNICTAKIARKSGRERVDDVLRRFGFGAPTGVDLPGERAGLLRPMRKWGEIELATISFGQGVTATPLQLAAGYASIANGGTLYRPRVTRRIVDDKGRTLLETQPEGRRVIDPAVARTMRTMLHAVTEKGGTGEKLAIPGYPAGGKTGTAQKVDPLTRRYSTEKWNSSFVGFAPLDNPRLVLFVVVDEPTGTHFGSAVAGPIWREVMVDALRYLNVPPTALTGPVDVADAADASPTPRASSPTPTLTVAAHAASADDGNGAVHAAAGESPRTAEEGYVAESEPGARELPDFSGMSLGAVLDAARRIDLPIEVSGTGLAVSQEPRPGRVAQGARCRVRFLPPG